MTDTQRAKLFMTLTEHDRKEARKPGHNPYALAHYAKGLTDIGRHCASGHPLRSAIITEFTGRLADKLLKAVGLDKMTDREARYGLDKRLPELPDIGD